MPVPFNENLYRLDEYGDEGYFSGVLNYRTGGSSSIDSQFSIGLPGGEIKNSRSWIGNCKCCVDCIVSDV